MRVRATNAALRDMRNEAGILANFSGIPMMKQNAEARQNMTLSENWLNMTAWVAKDGVPVIFNEEAKHIHRGPNPCLYETATAIGELTKLEEDWNDENAPAIDRASILWARNFVQWLSCVAEEQNLTRDCIPAVFPTIDGGVKLSWKANGHQVALTFRPGRNLIEVIEKSQGTAASHRFVAENEAGDIAIRAMRESL